MVTRRRASFFLSVGLLVAACGGKDTVSYNVYRQLRPGMTLREVKLRIGHPGRLLGGNEVVEGRLLTQPGESIYVWANRDGSQVEAAFQRDIMVAAAASGF